MSMNVRKENARPYKVQIFKNCNKRWGIRHPSGIIHHKDFASLAYAKVFCKRQDWEIAQ
jgi:hypothetical protein